jgi:hypothetical protein
LHKKLRFLQSCKTQSVFACSSSGIGGSIFWYRLVNPARYTSRAMNLDSVSMSSRDPLHARRSASFTDASFSSLSRSVRLSAGRDRSSSRTRCARSTAGSGMSLNTFLIFTRSSSNGLWLGCPSLYACDRPGFDPQIISTCSGSPTSRTMCAHMSRITAASRCEGHSAYIRITRWRNSSSPSSHSFSIRPSSAGRISYRCSCSTYDKPSGDRWNALWFRE